MSRPPPRIPRGILPHDPRPAGRLKARPQRNPQHLAWVRHLPCAVCLRQPAGQAHHLLRADPGRGMGRKAEDRWAIPLCPQHHAALHAAGDEEAFLADRGIDGRSLADALWRASGDLARAERALLRVSVRAQREENEKPFPGGIPGPP